MSVSLRFVGSGDAFGSGGRFQTCLFVDAPEAKFLIDCGASSLIAMRRQGIAPGDIEAILLTHLHGDHFGGLPYFYLDAVYVSRREAPLTVAGPPGTKERLRQLGEVTFPGMWSREPRFPFTVVEMAAEQTHDIVGLSVTPYAVVHAPEANPTALRIGCGGRIITYSGDTEWTEALIPAAKGADLFVSECYYYDKEGATHMNYRTLLAHRDEIDAKRIVLTHMSADMLDRAGTLALECADDGLVIEV